MSMLILMLKRTNVVGKGLDELLALVAGDVLLLLVPTLVGPVGNARLVLLLTGKGG